MHREPALSSETSTEAIPLPRKDVVDIAIQRRRLQVAEWAIGAAAIMGADVFGRDYGSDLLAMDAVVSGGLAGIAAGTAITAFNFLVARPLNRKRIARATREQHALREILNESVDLFSAPPKKGGSVLRWYAPDSMSDNGEPSDYADRLRKLVDNMEDSGIPRIAFSSRLLASARQSETTTLLGKIVDGTKPVKHLKGRSHNSLAPAIQDARLDKEMLVCSAEEARTLADILKSEQNNTRLAQLIAHTNNPRIMRAFELFLADKIPKLQVYNTVQRVITERLGDEMDLNFIADKSNPAIRGVNITDYTLRGNVLITTHTPRLRDGVLRESMGSGFTSIFHHLGIASKEELYDRIFSGEREPRQQEIDALWCAYLYLQEEEVREEETHSDVSGESQFAGNHNMPPTTLQLLEAKQGLLAAHTKDPEVTVRRRQLQFLGMVALGIVVAEGVSAATQFGLTAEWDKVDTTIQNACDATAKQWDRNHPGSLSPYVRLAFGDKYYCNGQLTVDMLARNPQLRIPNIYDNVMTYLMDTVQSEALAKTADLLIKNGVRPPSSLRDWGVDNTTLANSVVSHMAVLPPNQTTGEYGAPAVGDAAVNVNTAQYAIHSLSGKSSAGYWYEGVNNYLSITEPNPTHTPAYDTQDSNTDHKDMQLPSVTTEILAAKPDFSIDVLAYNPEQYDTFDGTLRVPLPVLKGDALVGAQLVDASNPLIATPVEITHSPDQQSYSATITTSLVDAFKSIGGTTATIRYYTKEAPHAEPKATKPFVVDMVDSNGTAAHTTVPTSVSNSVKKTLGLSSNATNGQVDDAIRQKLYSYTPFSDTRTIIPSDKNVTDTYAYYKKFGDTLARMSEVNCNVASTTALLAQNPGEEMLNEGFGYHDDGDGILTNIEAHQWNVNQNGVIEDATPGTFAPDAKRPPGDILQAVPTSSPSLPSDLPALAGGIGLGAALLIKRKKLLDTTKNLYYSLVMGNRHTEAALQVAEAVRYAAPGSRVALMKREQPSKAALEALIGADAKTIRTHAQERGIDVTGIPRAVWRQLNRLYAARNIITGRYQ